MYVSEAFIKKLVQKSKEQIVKYIEPELKRRLEPELKRRLAPIIKKGKSSARKAVVSVGISSGIVAGAGGYLYGTKGKVGQ